MNNPLQALFQRTSTDTTPVVRTAYESPAGSVSRSPLAFPILTPWQVDTPLPAVRGQAPGQLLHTIRGGQMMGQVPAGVHQDEMSSLFGAVPVGVSKPRQSRLVDELDRLIQQGYVPRAEGGWR